MNVTDLMLDYIIKKSNSDIGDEVYLKAKQCLIDYIGVTYGGAWENVNIIKDLDSFKRQSSIIVANRYNKDLNSVQTKVYTRDIFNRD